MVFFLFFVLVCLLFVVVYFPDLRSNVQFILLLVLGGGTCYRGLYMYVDVNAGPTFGRSVFWICSARSARTPKTIIQIEKGDKFESRILKPDDISEAADTPPPILYYTYVLCNGDALRS